MRVRRVIITKSSNIADLENLRKHANIKKYWHLPRDYTLFEFYHPVFERIYDNDNRISNLARKEGFMRHQSRAAGESLRSLLAPMYKGKHPAFQPIQLFFPGHTAFTEFLGIGKVSWPAVKLAGGWETDLGSRFRMKLVISTDDTTRELENIVQMWAQSGVNQCEIERVSSVRFAGEEAEIHCRFVAEGHDSIMALYMLLTDTRALTSLESFERLKV